MRLRMGASTHPHPHPHKHTHPHNAYARAHSGEFALWLDDTLHNGSSTTSLTFANECLAHAPQFSCVRLEIWAFA